MEIKCIALDLDRTTLNAQGHLSAGNRQALEYAIRRGVHIVIASGRSFHALPQDVVSIPGIEYAITSNGAAVYHVPTGRRLHGYLLPPESARAIVEIAARECATCEAFVKGVPHADAAYVANPLSYGVTLQGVDYIQRTRVPEPDMPSFINTHIHELDCIDLVVKDEETKLRLWSLLSETVPNIYITSSVPQLLEISHRDAGKHSGVRFVTELLGLTPVETAAFGDADNDVDMLKFVGCGIAVANATPNCLAAADRITAHHDEDGVAKAIYDLLCN